MVQASQGWNPFPVLGKGARRFMVSPFHVWANHRTFANRNQEMHILPFLNIVNKNSNPLNDMGYEKNDDDNGNRAYKPVPAPVPNDQRPVEMGRPQTLPSPPRLWQGNRRTCCKFFPKELRQYEEMNVLYRVRVKVSISLSARVLILRCADYTQQLC